jgi:hypothetical protein
MEQARFQQGASIINLPGFTLNERKRNPMTDIRQKILNHLEAFENLDELKAAILDWLNESDGSLNAFNDALEAQRFKKLRNRIRTLKKASFSAKTDEQP